MAKRHLKPGRSQAYNPNTGNWVSRDSETGKYVDVKSDGIPFKGVRKENTRVLVNPSIKKSTASKAEKAVIRVINKRAKK